MELIGHIEVGEASATLPLIQRRQLGAQLYLWWYAAVPLIATASGWLFFRLFGHEPAAFFAGVLVGMAGSIPVCNWLARRAAVRAFRKRYANADQPLTLPFSLTITPESLVYASNGVVTSAEWAAVTEVVEARDYWIFLVASVPIFAPKRHFVGLDVERTFIAQALEFMSQKAQLASPQARAFAASQGEQNIAV